MPEVMERNEAHRDSLVRNARSISSPWLYVGAKVLVAAVLMDLCQIPFIPLFLLCLVLLEAGFSLARTRVANGDLRFRAPYLVLVFASVCFWTLLAVALWQAPEAFSRPIATALLLTIPMMGVLRGFRDRNFLVLTTAMPLATLPALAVRDFMLVGDNVLLFSAGVPVIIGCVVLMRAVIGLHVSDQKLQQAGVEREQMLRELEASRARLEQVAKLSGVAGWEMNLYERQCTLSPAAQALLGVNATSFNLQGFAELFTERTAAPLADALADIERQNARLDVDVQLKSGSSEPRWIRVTGEILREGGEPVLFLGAMQDLSDRIRLAEKERQEEVAGALSRLSAQAAAAFKKDLADATHLLGGLGKIKGDSAHDRQLASLRHALDRAFDTALSLQAYAANNIIRLRVVSLNASVSSVVNTFRAILPSSVSLQSNANPRVIDAVLDESEIELALLHIFFNARDSMPHGGEITVSTGIDEKGWRHVDVLDTGHGIPNDIQHRVLEPFFTTKRANGARGLGLSVVRGIVEQSRGQLVIDSTPGTGTRVRMSFPPPGEGDEKVYRADLPEVAGTVLLVHPDIETFQRLSPVLLEAGLMLHHARSPRDAITMLEGQLRYEIILIEASASRTLPGQVLQSKLPRLLPGAKLLLTPGDGTGLTGDQPDTVDLSAPATELLAKLLASLPQNPQTSGIPGA